MNTSSIARPKASAIRNASGSDGSNLPFSIELIELRETLTRSASSAWLHFTSARRTRMRFFKGGSVHYCFDHFQAVVRTDLNASCETIVLTTPSRNMRASTAILFP
jgi:hypothetical protein